MKGPIGNSGKKNKVVMTDFSIKEKMTDGF
jgi:hypothetical protein